MVLSMRLMAGTIPTQSCEELGTTSSFGIFRISLTVSLGSSAQDSLALNRASGRMGHDIQLVDEVLCQNASILVAAQYFFHMSGS
jgi:hypothetical protein